MKALDKDTESIDKDIKGIIVHYKFHLESKRIIERSDSKEISDKYKIPVLETSVKDGTIINECFDLFVRGII